MHKVLLWLADSRMIVCKVQGIERTMGVLYFDTKHCYCFPDYHW